MAWKLKYIFYLLCFKASFSTYVCYVDEVHALILARGGSKGIKHKNLVEIEEGTSILANTITTIKNSGYFKHIWVSTDSSKIAEEANKYGALVHRRQEIYAQDETSSLEAVKEFLNVHNTITRFGLFQCTSVFLQTRYIVKAFNLLKKSHCVFAVTRSHKLRWTKVNGKIMPVNFNPSIRPRRQDWEGEFIENGMFYFSNRMLIYTNRFQDGSCSVVEVDAKDSLEIDTMTDLAIARCLRKENS